MAEEKQTAETSEPQVPKDDTVALQYVLEHVRGATPSSLSVPVLADDEA